MSSPDELAQSVSRAVEALVATLCSAHEANRNIERPASAPAPLPSLRIAIALSGGRDSIVLLHALKETCSNTAVTLFAAHVHHGLSRNANAWEQFCVSECARLDIPLSVANVQIVRKAGLSLEAQARAQRFEALRACDADVVALAHHADDQAETLLLQLLRGAGAHGLSAMPEESSSHTRPKFVRPLLSLPSEALAAYAQAKALRWVDDESNTDTRFRRNALRHDVVPLLRQAFPGYPATLVRAATLQAEAAGLLDELAQLDAEDVAVDDATFGLCLERAALTSLAAGRPARARNLLRWFLRAHELRAPSAARLRDILMQCTSSRADARTRIRHGGAEIALHAGRIVVHGAVDEARLSSLHWRGEERLDCPGGVLYATQHVGQGIAAATVVSGSLHVRKRMGGERLRLGNNRPRQAVSVFFNRARTPLWQRDQWPLIWQGDVLIAVPGMGVDPAYAAASEATGYALHWSPAS